MIIIIIIIIINNPVSQNNGKRSKMVKILPLYFFNKELLNRQLMNEWTGHRRQHCGWRELEQGNFFSK